MAATFENPAQFERDVRSANLEWKRTKDSSTKWSFGARPGAGCAVDYSTLEATGGSESQRAKSRPRGKWSDNSHWTTNTKREHNINKLTRGNWDMPAGRVRNAMNARQEVHDASRSIPELLPSMTLDGSQATASDGPLYSFDRTDSPGRPLALDIFVKPATARDTERFVEKEYEIVDGNGQTLKGRKARRNLRKSGSDLPDQGDVDVGQDEEFELV